MCDNCRRENPECPFCNIKDKFYNTWFNKDKIPVPCKAWIDFEQNKKGDFAWYAILNGDQYTKGHTMVILGCHMDQITEGISGDLEKKEKLEKLMLGINRVSANLKERLDNVEAVHVLCLCEGERTHHLHFHLVPRYNYKDEEKKYFKTHFKKRAEAMDDLQDFERSLKEEKIHGMWYSGYKEMNFVFTDFNKKSKRERVKELKELAELLQKPEIKNPFNE